VRRSGVIAAAGTLAVAGGLAGGTLYLGHQSDGKIAKGISADGIPLGGLTAEQAGAKLQDRLVAPLGRTIGVHHGNRDFYLDAKTAHIRADVDGMVAAAVARSNGSLITRAERQLTGGTVSATIGARVSYSRPAVRQLVQRVETALNRPAKDATLQITGTGISKVPGAIGLAVDAAGLEGQITKAMTHAGASRSLGVRTHKVMPKITADKLAAANPVVLTLDRASYQLHVFDHLQLVKSYDVAVGMVGLETPAGLYHIQNKAVDPAWSVPHATWTGKLAGRVIPGGAPNNPLKARWLGIFNGAGIHGIDPSEYGSIGHSASHGCVRMRIPDVIDLYPRVPVGAPIYIA